jgi:hypothetical protein
MLNTLSRPSSNPSRTRAQDCVGVSFEPSCAGESTSEPGVRFKALRVSLGLSASAIASRIELLPVAFSPNINSAGCNAALFNCDSAVGISSFSLRCSMTLKWSNCKECKEG